MSSLGVGKDVKAYCNKCKLNLAHIIVVMRDEKTPLRVQCHTCKATHLFKDPTAAKIKKTTSKGRTRKQAVPMIEIWKKAIESSPSTPQNYSPQTKFETGDILDHPSFGQGIVEKTIDRNKIEVMFQNDMKILAHNLG